MDLILNFYDALCSTREFVINGIRADYSDFGDKFDHCPEEAPDYGCGCMRFDPKFPTDEVLEKYHITLKEYEEICDKLVDGLSWGRCGWCC